MCCSPTKLSRTNKPRNINFITGLTLPSPFHTFLIPHCQWRLRFVSVCGRVKFREKIGAHHCYQSIAVPAEEGEEEVGETTPGPTVHSLTYTRATKNSTRQAFPIHLRETGLYSGAVFFTFDFTFPLLLLLLYHNTHTHKLRCSGRTAPFSTVTLPNPNLPLPAERQAKSAPPQTKQVAMNDRYTNYPQDRDPHHHHHAPASRTPSYSLPSYPSVPPKQIPHHHHHHHSSSSSSTSPGITDATPIRYSGYAQGPPSLSTSSISSSSYAGSADGENGDGDVDLVALLTERLAGAFDPLQLDRSLAVQAQTYATFHSLTRPLGGGE